MFAYSDPFLQHCFLFLIPFLNILFARIIFLTTLYPLSDVLRRVQLNFIKQTLKKPNHNNSHYIIKITKFTSCMLHFNVFCHNLFMSCKLATVQITSLMLWHVLVILLLGEEASFTRVTGVTSLLIVILAVILTGPPFFVIIVDLCVFRHQLIFFMNVVIPAVRTLP